MSHLPTTYAHYRFGREVLETLSPAQQQVISAHRDLFDLGVHGPDLLFYYKALKKNPVSDLGYRSHERTGRDFFTQAAAAANAAQDRDAALAYLYGVLCHFTLDRECHPYVGEKEKSGATHSEIEASFDRYLLQKDGLDPVRQDVTAHLHPSQKSAQVVADFYPPLDAQTVYQAEKSMKFILKTLVAWGLKRKILLAATHLAGKPSLGDLFIPTAQNPKCADSDEILFSHYQDALALSQTLFPQLEAVLGGTGDFGPGFDHTFGET
jgi:hypothetical protein